MNILRNQDPYTIIKLFDAGIQFILNIAILRVFSSDLIAETILIVNGTGLIYQLVDYSQGNLILSKDIKADYKDFIFQKRRILLLVLISCLIISFNWIGMSDFLFLFLTYTAINTTHRTFVYYFTSASYDYRVFYYSTYIILSIINMAILLIGLFYELASVLILFLILNSVLLMLPFILTKFKAFSKKKIFDFQDKIIRKSSIVWVNQVTYSLKAFAIAYYVNKLMSEFGKEFKLILIGGTIISTLAYSFLHQYYIRFTESFYYKKSFFNLLKIITPAIIAIYIIATFTQTDLNIVLITAIIIHCLNTGIYLILITQYTLSFSNSGIKKISLLNILGILWVTAYSTIVNIKYYPLESFLIIFAILEILITSIWIKNLFYSFLEQDQKL